jgi:hypothetical protein
VIIKTVALQDGSHSSNVKEGDICFCKIGVGSPRYISLDAGFNFSKWVKHIGESYQKVRSNSYEFLYCTGNNYCPSCKKEKNNYVSANSINLDNYCIDCAKELGSKIRNVIPNSVTNWSENLNIIRDYDGIKVDFSNNIVFDLEECSRIFKNYTDASHIYECNYCKVMDNKDKRPLYELPVKDNYGLYVCVHKECLVEMKENFEDYIVNNKNDYMSEVLTF